MRRSDQNLGLRSALTFPMITVSTSCRSRLVVRAFPISIMVASSSSLRLTRASSSPWLIFPSISCASPYQSPPLGAVQMLQHLLIFAERLLEPFELPPGVGRTSFGNLAARATE